MSNILNRLEVWRNADPDMSKLLGDTILHIESLRDEVNRLRNHNERLLQIIYQNQEGLESDAEGNEKTSL